VLEDSLTALAAAGGGAVVAAMATDAWQVTRVGIARLFRDRAEVEQRLDEDASLVASAEDPDGARQALVPAWGLRLRALLAEHPERAEELRSLISAAPAIHHSVQHNTAHANGRVFGVQHGNVVFHRNPDA
jgi:predicted trehalose synthase